MSLGLQRSRWDLSSLLAQSPFLKLKTLPGLHQVLKRLGISLQRGRSWIHSPDPLYENKVDFMEDCIRKGHDEDIEVVFLDELTYSIHATVSRDYAPQKKQPIAQRAIGYEKTWRIVGAMNCFSAKLTFFQRSQITVPTLIRFFKHLVKAYPEAKTIYVILDNWPVHFHPDVIDALQEQINPFEFKLPRNWQGVKPSGKYSDLKLPIQLVPLPTYASWLNPIEKLWKWLKKDLIHHHPFAQNFNQLKELVEDWLEKFSNPSNDLLSFTGLLKKDGIFSEAIFST